MKDMKVFVGLSHKGGTGRSVTIANLAYRFAIKGKNVCIIDFDLASPTMGSILDLPGLEAGVREPNNVRPQSIGDLLVSEQKAGQAEKAVVNVWADSLTLKDSYKTSYGRLSLIPGLRQLGDRIRVTPMAGKIPYVLDALRRNYEAVFIDARSGASNVVTAISEACAQEHTNRRELISAWLVHFRWTKQHLIGVADFLSNPKDGLRKEVNNDDRIRLIRSAFIDPNTIEKDARDWFLKRHVDLGKYLNKHTPESIRPLLGDVPLDPILQWQECIITSELAINNIANKATDEAFSSIADRLLEKY